MTDSFFTRTIGKSDTRTNGIALGCYSMSNAYGARSDEESVRVIQSALDRGINLIDTADYYGAGHNEGLVGLALKGRRDQALLSSKFGYRKLGDGPLERCGRPEYVHQACADSLRRLGVDHIDLYFQHRLDPEVPIEETVGAMAELVKQGKVRLLGLCEVTPQTLRRASAVHPISAVQAEYSLWTRDAEQDLLPECATQQTSFMAFSPLARGMLTGKLRSRDQLEMNDIRRAYPRFSEENFPKNLALVDQLGALAAEINVTISQLSLAWLLNSPSGVIPISGADTLPFLEENAGALSIRLTPEQHRQIGQLFSPDSVSGGRLHPNVERMAVRG